ncbi:hypothetical protein GA0070616_3124 [Micromonospora nigra]|uniref:Uncharacterized protein n=1 Tax=Micromonospora nigra TaxID=145857 RepID=A0A1C6S8A9_9ACTN|nr:hypothetical protein [Micromonospora nigra]SCL25540.1 hypothetical protein GA0070616_3124 [Micromonospora nigra]
MAGPADHVDWPTVRLTGPDRRATLEFDTNQLPSRVVVYRYPRVGVDGVPDETTGTETICGFSRPTATCSRTGDGTAPARVSVAIEADDLPYLVVHAAWPLLTGRRPGADVSVVSASWVIRVDKVRE